MEESLRKSESELSLLYASVSDVIFFLAVEPGEHFRFVSVNPAFFKATGLTSAMVIGKLVREVIPEPARALVLSKYREAIRKKTTIGWEEVSVYPTGTKHGVVRVTPVFDASGRCTNLVGTVHDVTERVEAERAVRLLDSVARMIGQADDFVAALRAILRAVCRATNWEYGESWLPSSDGAVLRFGPSWHRRSAALTDFRKASSDYVFVPGDSMPGRVWSSKSPEWVENIASAGKDQFRRAADARRHGVGAALGVPILWRGEVLAVMCFFMVQARSEDRRMVQAVQAVAGQLGGLMARKIAEDEKRAAEQKYRSLVESSLAGIYIVQDGTFRYVNPTFATMVGYTKDELIGKKSVLELVAHEYRPLVSENIRRRVEREVDSLVYVSKVLRKDGTTLDVEAHGSAIELDGRPAISGMMLDITDRKRLEELRTKNAELARASSLKDEFVANMSHELRTPLNAIIGLSEMMAEGIYGDLSSKQVEIMNMVNSAGRHLLDMITDILDLSRISEGKFELQPQTLNIREVCGAALRMVEATARGREQSLRYEDLTTINSFLADRRSVLQILLNLLSNAVKFTRSGGQIGLNVETPDGAIRFTVWDTGIGIENEELPRLFKPFSQLKSGLALGNQGSGLGLALVRRLTEMHGGRINVESKPGEGTRFVVEFPRSFGDVLGKSTS